MSERETCPQGKAVSEPVSNADVATICVDEDLSIRWLTPAVEQLLRGDLSGQPPGLEAIGSWFRENDLISVTRQVMSTLRTVSGQVTHRDGRVFLRHVSPQLLPGQGVGRAAVTFVDMTRAADLMRAGAVKKERERILAERARDLEEEVAERVALLEVLHDVTRISNEADSVEQGLEDALCRIARHDDWDLGHAWVRTDEGGPGMVSSGIWCASAGMEERETGGLRAFKRLCADHRFEAGQGLVGRVLEEGQPEWVDDIEELDEWKRTALRKVGLHAAAAFPVIADGEVVAVLQFFSSRAMNREARFLEIMPDVGLQLGHMMSRIAADRSMRRSEHQRRRQLVDLRRLAGELTQAEHRERQRLSRTLHDGLQQKILATRMRLSHLDCDDAEQRREEISRVYDLLSECLETTSTLSCELSPPVLQVGSIEECLHWLADWFEEKHGERVIVSVRDEVPECTDDFRVFIFHAVRELVLNSAKHAEGTPASVSVAMSRGWLIFEVEDDAGGFDPAEVEASIERGFSMGLFRIRERIGAFGGRFTISRGERGGGRFRIMVPPGRIRRHRARPSE